jgi:hypothetical protein
MPKQPLRKGPAGRRAVRRPAPPAQDHSAVSQVEATPAWSFETLKQNMKKIDKSSMFDALKRVKDMKPEAWKDPNEVRRLTESIAQGIGIRVDPRRIDAFMNAYQDATKNAGDKGPKVSVEDIARRYGGQAVDDKTIKEIKKFVK